MLKFKYPSRWEASGYPTNYYLHTYPNIKSAGWLTSHGSPNNCREFFVRSYREKINARDGFTRWALNACCLFSYGRPEPHNFEVWRDNLENDAEKSLFITNSFEKRYGWPLTKLHLVECENIKIPFVFFHGPRKWTMSPYLLSIWSLCIRLGQNKWMPQKLTSLDHKSLIRQLLIAAKLQGDIGDAWQISTTIKEWGPFMSLYKDLFGGINRKEHWATSHLNGSNDRPEGIMMLINGSTGYKTLREKYFRLKKEKNIK